jgi:formylglycine-generating enzyme required for sulfatase activity
MHNDWLTIPKSTVRVGFDAQDLDRLTSMYPLLGPEWYAECPSLEVDVDEFQIARYPVTCRDFCHFLNSTRNGIENGVPWFWEDSPYSLISLTSGSYMPHRGAELHPVTGISICGARAYAEFSSARLPTAFEWERAAKNRAQPLWPWGDRGPEDRCNHWEANPANRLNVMADLNDGRGTTPVDFFEPNELGVFDMLGNVWEWCEGNRDDDRAAALKGGSWNDILPIVTLPSFAHSVPPHYKLTYTFGLRLARGI